jgi:hypothetical protein
MSGAPKRGRLRPIRRKLLLLAFATLSGLALFELGLRAFTVFPIHSKDRNRRPHPVLGYVMKSQLPEIDDEGFRNPSGMGQVDVVAIGDSHTYGWNVESDESWPALLSRHTGRPVYNYGMGGYGALHYRALFDRALEKSPSAIVLGLYAANDFADVCSAAELDHWQTELAKLELGLESCAELRRGARMPGDESPRSERRVWLRSAIGSAVDTLILSQLEPLAPRGEFVELAYGERTTVISRRKIRIHARQTDETRPAVAAGIRALEEGLDTMIERARSAGVVFGVLFIPSKENVLIASADPSDVDHGALKSAVEGERRLIERFDRWLRARGVPTAHALGCLQKGFDRELYPRGRDGHPLLAGYECYAEAALQLLEDGARMND